MAILILLSNVTLSTFIYSRDPLPQLDQHQIERIVQLALLVDPVQVVHVLQSGFFGDEIVLHQISTTLTYVAGPRVTAEVQNGAGATRVAVDS